MRTLALFSMTLAAACGSDTICGDGTTKMGNTCVGDGTGSGSGSDTTCGTGTHLEGTTCVPDGGAAHGAPTITAITPDNAGIAGTVEFTITGTNFAGDDVSGLTVTFGGLPVDAMSIVASETSIAGTIPAGIDQMTGNVVINAPVSVTTNKGSAQVAFQYDALFAVDGIGYDGSTPGGELWLMDPMLGFFGDWGTLHDAANNQVGMSGITFDSAGMLWGVTNETSPRLVTIDLKTATFTPIGAIKKGTTVYTTTGLKFSGTTLYAWGSAASSSTSGLLKINTTTGAVTEVGTSQTQPSTWGGGLAVDNTGALYISNDGAGADALFSGVLNKVDATTGAVSSMATLDYYVGAPVTAIAFLGTGMFAAIDDGSYGAATLGPQSGVTFANVDMTQQQIVTPWYEMPAITSVPSHVTSMDFAPATLTIARNKPLTLSKLPAKR